MPAALPPADEEPQPLNAPHSRADLFWSFTWLALQGFGGVLAVVQRELVEKKRWMSNAQFVEEWAVAQILPGPNVVNLALMIGGRYFGASGAFSALAGMLFFPTLVVLAVAAAFGAVADLQAAQGALRGMGAVAAGLLIATGIKLMAALRLNVMGLRVCLALAALSFAAVALLRVPMVWMVLVVGVLSSAWAWRCLGVQAAAGALPGAKPTPPDQSS